MLRRIALCLALSVATPALANDLQPPAPADALVEGLPPPVQAMVEDALSNGSDAEIAAVIRFARRAYPQQASMLDTRVAERSARLAAARRQQIADAGPTENWHGRGEIGATLSTGSTDNLGLYASLDARREGIRWTHQFRARASVQETNGVRTQEQLLSAYEPRYTVDDRLSTYGLLQFERDPFLGYDARYTASLGLGYALLREPGLVLNVQGGPAYRIEERTTGGTQDGISGRAALDARLTVRPGLLLTQTASAFLDWQGRTYASATGLEAQLVGQLSARLSYNVQHEDRPDAGLRTTDTQSRVSFVYGF